MGIRLRLFTAGCALLLAGCNQAPTPISVFEMDFVGSSACVDCHISQYDDWLGSDHDLAMRTAGASSVRGDFSETSVEYYGSKTRFRESGELAGARRIAEKLADRHPEDRNVAALLQSLK